jgi:hypothetical protein
MLGPDHLLADSLDCLLALGQFLLQLPGIDLFLLLDSFSLGLDFLGLGGKLFLVEVDTAFVGVDAAADLAVHQTVLLLFFAEDHHPYA